MRHYRVGLAIVAALVLIALTAPLLTALEGQDATGFHPELVNSALGGLPNGALGGISADHWLGVEPGTGRDIFARIVYGAQVSLGVAIGATVVQVLIGTTVGLAAGMGGRLADGLLTRGIDLMMALPELIFAIALLVIVPAGFPRPLLLAGVIGVFGWGGTARLVRAQTLSLRTRDYVAAARLAGAGRVRVARREILPGVVAPVLTYAALLLPGNIVSEAGLSFLGIGVRPPTPSWGQMLSNASVWFRSDPMYVIIPAAAIFLAVLAFTLLGDGVRKAANPRTTGAAS
ncbi:peptide ABC transporter permease [Planotetraspora thailandica]|uniref:Peptide ABC transporter permease n=1 Tax=Planotetraspora thailandica TaxID=487172 RepID=A0A8J3UWB7_9ACTN|nr:ABC transporter permease [Planotetraspora thailandica]GII52592.1 peptide ABC transporter permease [Planotetraspora thailandica]